MNRKIKSALMVALIGSLLAVATAWAMSSANFRLDWFTPLTGGGGGPIASTSYRANFTVGQTVVGSSASTHYKVGLGFWYGTDSGATSLFLPLTRR